MAIHNISVKIVKSLQYHNSRFTDLQGKTLESPLGT